ncbi:Signal peptidase I [bioreactor metagenome]|uniref:signal peptidase I n=1 Tax=bioreactor metagenome TaxID=1076179 RepID=A0A645GX03_9ZZZZ
MVITKRSFFEGKSIVKRVIAVGGQTVDIDYDAGLVYVDGQALDEPYVADFMAYPDSSYMVNNSLTVPEGSIFVMGDNRNHSTDSRDLRLGTVDERYVLGRALIVVLPLGDFGVIR